MTLKRFPWIWVLALMIGFGLGLTYTWVISPVQYIDAEPHTLRDDFKDHYRSAIAAAYASDADLDRARARLALLRDPYPPQALAAQAQRMVAVGESPDAVQQVAMLASALEGKVSDSSPVVVTPTPPDANEPTIQPLSDVPTNTITATPLVSGIEPTSTLVPILTATPRPTRTTTPTLGAPYQLVGQDTLCDQELAEGLLQIFVTNTSRKQIPGAEIIITWNDGEEHIFTGLKPELHHGYADYLMDPDVIFSVRMKDGGTPATDLSVPDCTDADGNPYFGGIRISFQRP